MALQKLVYRAGLNREGTNYSNEGGFYDGDKVRFRSGQPEKIGGWIQVATSQFLGHARSLWTWIDADGVTAYIGLGTNVKYYIYYAGTYNDITPIYRKDGTALSAPNTLAASPISTAYSTLNGGINASQTTLTLTSGTSFPSAGVILIDSEKISYTGKSGNVLNGLTRGYAGTTAASHSTGAAVGCYTVTLTDANYSPNVGDYIIVTSSATVGGLTISGEYIITSVPTTTTFTISSANASSTAAGSPGGGTVTFEFEYPTGLDVATTGLGWGAGPWSYTVPVILGNNPLATSTGTPTVITVTQTAHGLTTGNWVFISGATSIGGIPASSINTNFIVTVLTANTYTITTQSSATSTVAAGGGSNVTVYPQNGSRGWGSASSVGLTQQLRLWTNDNYGADLAIAPRGGPIYYWKDSGTVSTRAVSLSSLATLNGNDPVFVPTQTFQVLSSSIQQFLIAMGSNSYNGGTLSTVFNPMLVRWSDQANPTQWVPAVTNQSGEFALTNGSYIMTSQTTRQGTLIWTDSCLYSMQYIGYPYVFSFQVLMDNISILSPNSAVTVANVTYWIGKGKFYMYAGTVQTLPCSLRQYIFTDINLEQAFQVFAGANEAFNEVWWFYCSIEGADGTGTVTNPNTIIDKYVIYNYQDKVWSYGTMARTAWLQYGINPSPVAADYNSRLLYHEVGTDDVSTSSPQPIVSYVQSSDFGIEAGDHLGFVWRILPDVNFNGSTVNQPSVTMTLYGRQNSGAAYVPSDIDTVTSANNYQTLTEYTIQQYTGQVYTRLRGRQMAFQIKSTGLGVSWQLGTPRIDLKPAGRR